MALLILDTFEHLYNLRDKYTTEHNTLVSVTGTYGRGDQTQSIRSYTNYYCAFDIPEIETGVIGFAMYNTNHPTGTSNIIELYKGATRTLMLSITKSGFLQIRRGTTVVAQCPSPICRRTKHFIEMKFNCVNSISADSVQVKIDGELLLNVPVSTDCQDAATSGADQIRINGFSQYGYFNGVYICDLTGSTWNDFQGDFLVETLYPSGDGTTNDFTGSDANSIDNYLLVDDAQADDDSTYTESSTVTDVDLYSFDDLAWGPDTILAVVVDCYCLMDDAGPKSGKIITYIDSSTYEGDTFSLTEGYLYETQIWELNPGDSAAWEVTDVNNAEFGVKVEA